MPIEDLLAKIAARGWIVTQTFQTITEERNGWSAYLRGRRGGGGHGYGANLREALLAAVSSIESDLADDQNEANIEEARRPWENKLDKAKRLDGLRALLLPPRQSLDRRI